MDFPLWIRLMARLGFDLRLGLGLVSQTMLNGKGNMDME